MTSTDTSSGAASEATPHAAPQATLYSVEKGAAWITLNRPANRNALSTSLVNELYDHLATAIDDPAVDINSLVYMQPWYQVTATANYPWRLARQRTLSLDLRVSNLLNESDQIYNSTSLRPPGGDLASPARVSGGGTHYYLDPRTVSVSARLSF